MARIAVADDDAGLLEFATRILAARGHEVVAYKDGQDLLDAALAAGPETRPELVVSDVQMPRLDGIGLCRALRKQFSKAALPVVLVSVLEAEDDILRGFEAGANDYLVKPYRAPVLVAKVQVLLREREILTPFAAPFVVEDDTTGPLTDRVKLPFTIDKYDVEGEIGRGGMGTVYRAKDRDTGRPVALKIISRRVADDRVGLARFFREAATLARIDSPHVVRAIDSGMERGRYFLAMDLVTGKNAKTRLNAEGPLPVRAVVEIGRDIALALAALQEKGLVHRDMKPSNIIMGEDGRSTLVDFGLARSQKDQALTETGEAIGTPHYIAPEVLRGAQADIRSDLYSLGATLYELLAGQKPFPGATVVDVYQNMFTGPPPPLKDLVPEIPKELVALIDALIERDPALRRDNPAAVAEEMAGILEKL
ncbi:protein kinase [bacterium]|nr:protein kinase [bacterium]